MSCWPWAAGAGGGRARSLASSLDAEPGPAQVTHFDPAELKNLRAPVQRYLRMALTSGQPLVSGLRLTQSGRIGVPACGLRWQSFAADQQVATCRTGLPWNARVSLFAGLDLWLRDGYLNGTGLLRAAVPALLSMPNMRGAEELARSRLLRFLAESPGYPTALLPSQGVRWAAVNASQADATLADGAVSVTLRFRFGDAGMVDTVRCEARGRGVGSRLVMTPWEGRWKDWASRDGMRVPADRRGGLAAAGRAPDLLARPPWQAPLPVQRLIGLILVPSMLTLAIKPCWSVMKA